MISLLQFALFAACAIATVLGLWKFKNYLIRRGHADKIEKFNKLMEPRYIREGRRLAESITLNQTGFAERMPRSRKMHVHVVIED